MTKQIKIMLVKRDMTVGELAEKLGYTSQNLSAKFGRDNFSINELKQIADALDCDFEAVFVMRDTNERV